MSPISLVLVGLVSLGVQVSKCGRGCGKGEEGRFLGALDGWGWGIWGISIVTAQVGWDMGVGMAGNIWIGVDACSWRAPVRSSGSKEVGGGDWHGWGVGGHEVDLLLVGVVGRHIGKVRGVLVHGRLGGVRLQCLSDAVEVELVGITLAMHFGHDVLVIVVAQCAAQLVIVHVGLAFALAPAPRDFVRVGHLELAVGPLPGDAASVGAVRQELQEELPQLDLT